MPHPIARRAVVAAAWSAPVVVAAAAAPSAMASTTGFDLTFDPPQLGSSTPIFNEDYTRLILLDEPIAIVVSNHGTAPSPSGFTMRASYDRRLWRMTSATGRINGVTDTLPVQSRSTAGDVETVTFTIPVAIPPATDSFTGYFVRFGTEFLGAYPNDHVDSPQAGSYTMPPLPGDLAPSNNIASGAGFTDGGPISPWGVIPTATYEDRSLGNGVTVKRPTTITWTSVGPNPSPAGSQLTVGTDAQGTSTVRLTNVRLNGAADAGAISFVEQTSYAGQTISATYDLNGPLAKDDVLTFDVVYTDVTPSVDVSQAYPAQANFLAPDPNSDAQRARDQSYLQY